MVTRANAPVFGEADLESEHFFGGHEPPRPSYPPDEPHSGGAQVIVLRPPATKAVALPGDIEEAVRAVADELDAQRDELQG